MQPALPLPPDAEGERLVMAEMTTLDAKDEPSVR
jgi:hypothetical protein